MFLRFVFATMLAMSIPSHAHDYIKWTQKDPSNWRNMHCGRTLLTIGDNIDTMYSKCGQPEDHHWWEDAFARIVKQQFYYRNKGGQLWIVSTKRGRVVAFDRDM